MLYFYHLSIQIELVKKCIGLVIMKAENKKTLMLVEDDFLIALGKQKELEKYGYNVIHANTGEKAVQISGENLEIDLILMDIDLGVGIDGTEAAELILKDRDVPVVFMSSHTEPEIVEKTEKITSYGYVVKGSSNTVLDASIKMAFRLFEEKKRVEQSKNELAEANNRLIKSETEIRDKEQQLSERVKELDCIYKISEIVETPDITLKEILQETAEVIPQSWQYTEICEAEITLNGQTFQTANFALTKWCLKSDLIVHGVISGEVTVCYREKKPSLYEGPFFKEERKLIDVITERLGKIIERMEVKKKIANILNNINGVMWSISWPDLKPLYISPSVEKLYGRSKQEFMDNPALFKDVIHIDDQHLTEKAIKQLIEEGEAERECRIIKPDGSIVWVNDKSKMIYDENHLPIMVEGFAHDITERKRANDALIENEAFLNETGSIAKIGGWKINLETQELTWTKEVYNLHEVSDDFQPTVEEAIDFYDSHSKHAIQKAVDEAIQHGTPFDIELTLITAKNNHLDVRALGNVTKDENGKANYVIGTFQDITERKQVEEAIQRSEEHYQTLFEQASDAIFIINSDTDAIININRRACELYGYSKEEFLTMKLPDFQAPEVRGKEGSTIKKALEQYGGNPFEAVDIHRDGTRIDVEVSIAYFKGTKDQLVLTIVRDITDRRQTEKAMQENKERLRSIIANTEAGYFFIDKDGFYRAVNEAWLKMHGYSSTEEVIGQHFSITQINSDMDEANKIIKSLLEGKQVPQGEFSRRRKDGSIGYHNFSINSVIQEGEIVGLEGFIIDTTEKKQIDELLNKERYLLQTLINALPESAYFKDKQHKFLLVNKAKEIEHGISPGYAVGKTDFDFHPKRIAEKSRADDNYVLTTGNPILNREEELSKSGSSLYWGMTTKLPLYDESGSIIGTMGITRDITERKEAEEKLLKSRDYIYEITNSIGDIVLSVGIPDRKIEWVNNSIRSIGYEPSECIGETTYLFYQDEKAFSNFGDVLKKAIAEDKDIFHTENILKKKNGESFLAEITVSFHKVNNEIVSVIAVLRDITERKQAEEEILAISKFPSENPNSIMRVSKEGSLLYANEASQLFLKEWGYDENVGINDKWKQIFQDVFNSKTVQEIEVPCGERLFLFNFVPVDKLNYINVYGQDITERKQAEERIIISNQLLKEIERRANIGAWTFDIQTLTQTWSEQTFKILEIDTSAGEPKVPEGIGFINPPHRERAMTAIDKAIKYGEPYDQEWEITTNKGNTKWVQSICSPIQVDGKTVSLSGSFQDITKRKQAEEEIKQQLLEKEIILKESHHRIKNNFNSIGSLLSLQANSSDNTEVQSVLNIAMGRVHSMAVLYEKLLLTDNYQATSVKKYLTSLIDDIIPLISNNSNLTVEKQLDDIEMESKKLFPIGLIVNELLTNIMKYAFKGRDSGLIEVVLKEDGGDITLSIQDNGNGLPEGFHIDSQKGFGLMLIKMLSKQLGGSFNIENNNGTKSVLEFKK